MNLKQCKDRLRRRLDDLATPLLWSNAELVEYINEAHREAAERARLIYDEDGALTQVSVTAGTARYELDPAILGLNRVVLESNGLPLRRRTTEWMDENCPGWERNEGAPRVFVEREKYLVLSPTPLVDDAIRLSLWRVPLEPLDDDDDEPEFAPRHHERMLDWAVHLAYLKRDADTYDEQKADRYEASFERSFGMRRDSNVQRKQRLHRVLTVKPQW